MSNISIWLIDRALSGATSAGPCGPWSNVNEWVVFIPQSSCITGVSTSDFLVPYPEHVGGNVSYISAEIQSVYSTDFQSPTRILLIINDSRHIISFTQNNLPCMQTRSWLQSRLSIMTEPLNTMIKNPLLIPKYPVKKGVWSWQANNHG